MPNWCDNNVMIKGPTEEINKIKDFLVEQGNVFSFERILPCPAALRNAPAPNRNEQSVEFNKKKYGAADWYDWSVNNWGTKWNSSDTVMHTELEDKEEKQIGYSFQTAWAPPLPLYDKLAEMFPNTNIFVNFDESGCDFAGWRLYVNGKVEKEVDYETSYLNIRTFMEPDSGVWEWLE